MRDIAQSMISLLFVVTIECQHISPRVRELRELMSLREIHKTDQAKVLYLTKQIEEKYLALHAHPDRDYRSRVVPHYVDRDPIVALAGVGLVAFCINIMTWFLI